MFKKIRSGLNFLSLLFGKASIMYIFYGYDMCGIVAATSTRRNVVPLLVQGLKRLEYRGYDSCGVAVWNEGLKRVRSVSRVSELSEQIQNDHIEGYLGIAHTRWATHGAPLVCNAHPHFAGDQIALIHNGIIENYEEIREDGTSGQ